MFLIGGSHFQRFLGGLYVILNIVSAAGQLLTAMAFGSNSSLVLAESSPIAKSRLTLSNVSTVYQTAPVVSYSTPVLQHLASSNLLLQRKTSFKENDNRVGAMRAAHLVDDLSLASHFHREELCLDVADASYSSWMADHPSALSLFDHMIAAAKGKHIAVFLDYDGTLSPIVEDPEKAFMSDAMRSTVQDVAKFFPTAIISGRSRDKVFDFVQLSEIYYAGSHGMDIMAPAKASSFVRHAYTRARDQKNNEVILFQPASEFLPMINEVFKLLQEKTKQIHGARVENNKFCVTVHFRCVEEMNWSALAEIVRNVLTQFPRLQLNLGKKILEIKPSIQWHKGNALEFLLQALGLANSTDVIPLYIGDDSTDEDAFKVLQTRGQGYSILVSSVPKETSASYSLRDPTEVMGFLRRLVKWKKNCSTNR